MSRTFFVAGLLLYAQLVTAQIERVYGDDGLLMEIIPLNSHGEYEGTGYRYYPGGAVAAEVPYADGEIQGELRQYYESGELAGITPYVQGLREGIEKEYFPDSTVKALRSWADDHLSGWSRVYYPSGALYLYTFLRSDSIILNQRFEENGPLAHELIGSWEQPLDTLHLLPTRIMLKSEGDSLIAGQPNQLQIVVPGVPITLIRFTARDGLLNRHPYDELPWFLTVTPASGAKELTIFLRISLRPGASASVLRQVRIPVKKSSE